METRSLKFDFDKGKVLDAIRRFSYSNVFLCLLVLISFTTWVTHHTLVGIYFFITLCTISLIVNRDITPSLFYIPLMLVTTSEEDFLAHAANFNSLVVAAVLFSVALIAHIIIYRQGYKTGKLVLPLSLVSIVMFIGGIGSPYIEHYFDNFVFVVSLGPLMLALYIIARSCSDMPKDIDKKIYYARVIALFAVIAALQVLVLRLRVEGDLITNLRAPLQSGWANRNGLATLLILGMGVMFYYADNAKRFNFFLYNVAFALDLALVFTYSRGGGLVGCVEMVAIFIYMFAKGKHRKQFAVVCSMWILGIIITFIACQEYVPALIAKLKEIGMDSSGRLDLYKEAWGLFKAYPIFGVGFGYYGDKLHHWPNTIYWIHNTVLQVMSFMGTVGLAVYIYYYISRLKMWFSHMSPFMIFAFFSACAFEGQAMLDTGTFSSIPFLYLSILLDIFAELVGDAEDEELKDKLISEVRSEVDTFNAEYFGA